MVLIMEPLYLPEKWSNIMEPGGGSNPTVVASYDNRHKVTSHLVDWGIRNTLLEYVIKENKYSVPENEHDQILQKCQFLKLFNIPAFYTTFGKWYVELRKETKFDHVSKTWLYKTVEELKNDLKKQFENKDELIKINMEFEENDIYSLIKSYSDRYSVSLGYAVVLFYQCGRARDIGLSPQCRDSIDKLFEQYQKDDPSMTPQPVTDMVKFLDRYTVSYDQENVYLHTPDTDPIKCSFDKLDLYL